MTTEEEIWAAIEASNDAWASGKPEGTAALFAEDAVAVAPGLAARLEGRDAIVQSYVDYCREVRTHAFRVTAHMVDVRGETAIATYRFEVSYQMGDQVLDEAGQEILVLAKRDARWQAIWRTQVLAR